MKKIFALTLYVFLQLSVFATNVDSLFIVLKKADNITKLTVYEKLCITYYSIDLDSAGIFANKKLKLAKDQNNTEQEAIALKLIGNVCYFKSEYQQAINTYKKVISISKNNNYKELLASALNNIGMVHEVLGEYELAIEKYNMVIKIDSANNNLKGIGSTLTNIGNIYLNKSKYYDAITYYKKALLIAQELNDKPRIISAYNNLGLAYHWLSDFDNTSKYYFLALRNAEKIEDNTRIISILLNIGSLYQEWNDLQKALSFYLQTKNLCEKIQNTKGLIRAEENIGIIFNELQKPDSAIIVLTKAINTARKEKMNPILSSIYLNLGLSYELKKEFNKAQEYYLMSLALRKNLNNDDDIASSLNSLGHMSFLIKDYANAINYIKQSNSIAIYSYTKISNYKLLSEIYEEVHKPTLALQNYKKYSELSDSIFSNEKHQQIQELLAKYETDKKEQQIVDLENKTKLQKLKNQKTQLIAGLTVLGLVLFIIAGIFIYIQRKLKTEKAIAVSEQKLLRAQMNPHFIFNAISAIQHYVIKKQALEASSYLSSFAKLMRSILNNSKEELVTLETEKQTLDDYLKLQNLRLNGKLDYNIEGISDMDLDELAIPPMLLQPFIENAIEHGILKKINQEGKITISFSEKNNKLVVKIIDDGIGRENAAKNSNNKHKSFAIEITKSRIKAMKQSYKKNISFNIVDLKNEEDKPIGTKVIFELPLIYI